MRLAVGESTAIRLGICPVVELDARVLLIWCGSTREKGTFDFNTPTGK